MTPEIGHPMHSFNFYNAMNKKQFVWIHDLASSALAALRKT